MSKNVIVEVCTSGKIVFVIEISYEFHSHRLNHSFQDFRFINRERCLFPFKPRNILWR